jgi:hypothetical protein
LVKAPLKGDLEYAKPLPDLTPDRSGLEMNRKFI